LGALEGMVMVFEDAILVSLAVLSVRYFDAEEMVFD
jgi:hypothetical protein